MYRYGWPATHKPSVKSLHACTPRLWIPTSFIPRPALSFHPLLEDPLRPVIPLVPYTPPQLPVLHRPIPHDATEFIHVYGPWQKWYRNTQVRIYNNSRTHSTEWRRNTHTHTHTHTPCPLILSGKPLSRPWACYRQKTGGVVGGFEETSKNRFRCTFKLPYIRVYLICDNAAATAVYRLVFSSLTTPKTR